MVGDRLPIGRRDLLIFRETPVLSVCAPRPCARERGIRACAEIGDAQAIAHLRELARRHQKSPLIGREVQSAIRKTRNG